MCNSGARRLLLLQNSSNPSRRKNFNVRPYKVLLLTCVVNCTAGTALFSSPAVSALGFESGDPGSSPGQGVVPLRCAGKKFDDL